jgi:hypothetical protein
MIHVSHKKAGKIRQKHRRHKVCGDLQAAFVA